MATIYVDDSASGANNGTSWADAYVSFDDANTNAASGDAIFVSHTHNEAFVVDKAWSFVNGPVSILSVDSTTDVPTYGAILSVEATNTLDIYLDNVVYMYGMEIRTGTLGYTRQPAGMNCIVLNCKFTWSRSSYQATHGVGISSGTIGGAAMMLIDNVFGDSQRGSLIQAIGGRTAEIVYAGNDIEFTGLTPASHFKNGNDIAQVFHVYGAEYIASSTTMFLTTPYICVYFGAAHLPTIDTTNMSQHYTVACGDSGSMVYWEHTSDEGQLTEERTTYMTGGAEDIDATAYSWKVVTTGRAYYPIKPYSPPPLRVWLAAGTHTLTVEVLTTSGVDDQSFYIEARTKGNNQAGSVYQSKCPLGVAATSLASSSETWVGTAGTEQKVSLSVTAAVDGWADVYLFFAGNLETYYVNPVVEVS